MGKVKVNILNKVWALDYKKIILIQSPLLNTCIMEEEKNDGNCTGRRETREQDFPKKRLKVGEIGTLQNLA